VVFAGVLLKSTISDNHTTNGSGTGSFVSSITGIDFEYSVYVRAYATNSTGTAYGNQVSFTSTGSGTVPTVTTNSTTNISQTSATSGGNVTSLGSSSVTARGVCWSTSSNPTISNSHTTNGGGTGSYTSNITGLTANTPYYVRAYATNSAGTAYGSQVSFTTTSSELFQLLQQTPSLILPNICYWGRQCDSTREFFVTIRGVCWSTSTNPTTANSHTLDAVERGVL